MNLIKLHKSSKRVGRGIAAGGGKTAGRGTKGQNSRNGKKRYTGFQTGALPLAQRLPKYKGIKPANTWYTLSVDLVNDRFEKGEAITVAKLQRRGLIGRYTARTVVKVVKGQKPLAATIGDDRIRQSASIASK